MSGPVRWGRPLTPEEIAQDKRRQENDRKYGPGNWVDFTSPHELYGDSQARAIEARRALAADIAAAVLGTRDKGEPVAPMTAEPAPPQDQADNPEARPAKDEPRQTEINRWLRDTWEAEGRPGGAAFFRLLKKYQRQPGSPIREWWQAGGKAGFEYETSAGSRKKWTRKNIQNKASAWKKTAASDNP